jgi:hypothetical protein
MHMTTKASSGRITAAGSMSMAGQQQSALPTNQMQSNKQPNKSIKYARILYQIKQMENTGFEMTFDIFDTGYKVKSVTCQAGERVFATYPEPDGCQTVDPTNQSYFSRHLLVSYA